MNITRYNYEEYFILYIDNELSANERKAVEQFVQQYPDLEEELTILKQTRLVDDERIKMAGKDILLKRTLEHCRINETNYQEFFLLYIDNELNIETKKLVESFVNQHQTYKQKLLLLKQTKLKPDLNIQLSNKRVLYRREKNKKPVVAFTWQWMSVAALLIILLGLLKIENRNNDKNKPDIAGMRGKREFFDSGNQKKLPQQSESINQSINSTLSRIPSVHNSLVNTVQEKKERNILKQSFIAKNQNKQRIAEDLKGENKNEETPTSILITENSPKITSIHLPEKTAININISIAASPSNTAIHNNSYAVNTNIIEDAEETISSNINEKKNKFRGLFRKATRVFERITNVSADKKEIHIANFAIALK